jgi:hypothetical protein
MATPNKHVPVAFVKLTKHFFDALKAMYLITFVKQPIKRYWVGFPQDRWYAQATGI